MPAASPAISSGAFKKLLAYARELGLDSAALAAQVALDVQVCDDADARIPIPRLHELWEAVLAACERTHAVPQVAPPYAIGDYSLVGFVCATRPTLGDAISSASRYLALWTDEPGLRLHEDGLVEFVYRTTFVDRPGLRCADESALAEILHGARQLLGNELAPIEVSFSHSSPALAAHETFFRAPVRFRRPGNSLRFSREQLDAKLPVPDPQLASFLRDLAERALDQRCDDEPPMLDQVRRIIAEDLRTGVPTLGQIAKRLAVSERTLRRRLLEDGHSFRELLDETRASLSRNYVRDRSLPLAEVAFLLGFSDASAFHRAFRRWHKATPAAYRNRAV